eukprot:6191167-Pleurochrysis_carterae.AAC.4
MAEHPFAVQAPKMSIFGQLRVAWFTGHVPLPVSMVPETNGNSNKRRSVENSVMASLELS